MRKLLAAILAALLVLPTGVSGSHQPRPDDGAPNEFNEFTVAQLQAKMANKQLSSVDLTNFYIKRILKLDQAGPGVNAVIELNPDALTMAREADKQRNKGTVLGPLHGIP